MSSAARTVTDTDIVARAAGIPDAKAFPTVDELLFRLEELRLEHPELLTVARIGTSRRGEPISLYTLRRGRGSARKRGLIVGGVHPNEPIGSLTISHLVSDLLADADFRETLDTDWYIIPCVDPDGMRLNEGWFDNPFDGETYFRHFYRPAGNEQVEWTFPVNYKRKYFDAMMPETQALQRTIDDVQPHFYVPLHNSETGGAYYYVSPSLQDLVPLLHRLPGQLGIPLHLGEPESSQSRVMAPAVYAIGSVETAYEWQERHGLDPAPPGGAGQSSTSYSRKYGTESLIAELPIWHTFGADDTRPSDRDYASLLREAGEALAETSRHLSDLLDRVDALLEVETPYLRSARAFIPGMRRTARLMTVRSEWSQNARPATIAERPMAVVWMYRLRYGGALLRALESEVCAGLAKVEVRRAAADLEQVWTAWLEERLSEERPEGIPLAHVAGVQYGAILGVAARSNASQRGEQGRSSDER